MEEVGQGPVGTWRRWATALWVHGGGVGLWPIGYMGGELDCDPLGTWEGLDCAHGGGESWAMAPWVHGGEMAQWMQGVEDWTVASWVHGGSWAMAPWVHGGS